LPDRHVALAQELIAFAERDIALPEVLVALPDGRVPLPLQLVSLSERDVALTQDFISLPERDVTLMHVFIALTERDVTLMQKFVALPDPLIALVQLRLALRGQDVGTEADILELEPELSATIKAAKAFEQAHEGSQITRCHVAAAEQLTNAYHGFQRDAEGAVRHIALSTAWPALPQPGGYRTVGIG
jgi:hypothetical protein